MKLPPAISAIHHITAVTSNAAENLRFYTEILGLRLVKKTVNFDDPYTYHLYYGDEKGTPGTILTFFPWSYLPKGTPGAGMVTAVSFAVDHRAMDFWFERLSSAAVVVKSGLRFGQAVLEFTDPHGLPLEIIGTSDELRTHYWKNGPMDSANAILGFHSATATVHAFENEIKLITELMSIPLAANEENRYRFKMSNSSSPGHFFDVIVDPHAPKAVAGSGTVHHIAFRAPDKDAQLRWQTYLRRKNINVTPVRDRKYFKSIYFLTYEQILYEIATDSPGFLIDEPLENLGHFLRLPDQFEMQRDRIAKQLPPLLSNDSQHD